jgi:hypothetical protein
VDYTKISLAEAIREIDQVTVQVKRDFGSLTPTQLNWKPTPDRWSIGERLEHLIATNGTYFEVVESILLRRYRKPFLARLPVLPKMYGRWLVGEMSPQSERKVPTMAVFEPARSESGPFRVRSHPPCRTPHRWTIRPAPASPRPGKKFRLIRPQNLGQSIESTT